MTPAPAPDGRPPAGPPTTPPSSPPGRRERRETGERGRGEAEVPLGRPEAGDRAPRVGFLAETFIGFAQGGLERREAPSEERLEELNTLARTDLPTQAILEGEVDVGEIRDFFSVG